MTEVIIVLLALISGLVTLGVKQRVNMWGWITVYWFVLTIKNILDLLEV